MSKKILILDDDVRLAKTLAIEFSDHGYQPIVIKSIGEIPAETLDYAIVDVRLAGEFGLNAIEKIRSRSPDCKIVILSGYGSIATAVDAVKRGAVHYLVKPANFNQLEEALLGKDVKNKTTLRAPSLSQVQSEYIDYVLVKNEGNISKTAKDLGIHRQSLQRKLKKHS